jgi:hypothetical protein
VTAAGWSARDELIYWLQAAGTYTVLGVIAVVRFALAVVFRVLDMALWLAGIVAVLGLVFRFWTPG